MDMNEINPVLFPQTGIDEDTQGMDLRDWFAGQALGGLLAAKLEVWEKAIYTAYEIADRMLEVRGGG